MKIPPPVPPRGKGLPQPAGTPSESPPRLHLAPGIQLTVLAADREHLLLAAPDGTRLRAFQPRPPLAKGALLQTLAIRPGARPVVEILPRLASLQYLERLRRLPPAASPRAPDTALQLLALAGRMPSLSASLPRETVVAVHDYLDRLPTPATLRTPEALRRAVRDSGLFLEARLASAATANPSTTGETPGIENDLGLALHRLAGLLRMQAAEPAELTVEGERLHTLLMTLSGSRKNPDTGLDRLLSALFPESSLRQDTPSRQPVDPGELWLRLLRDAAETLLGRLHEQQKHLAEQREQGRLDLHLELPVRRDDLVDPWRLHIQRAPLEDKRSRKQRGTHRWRVRLDLRLPELGPLRADLSLTLPDAQVAVHFLTESAVTMQKIQAALPHLAERLAARGLRTEQMGVRQGKIPAAPEETPAGYGKPSLLDEQA